MSRTRLMYAALCLPFLLTGCASSQTSILKKRRTNQIVRMLYPNPASQWKDIQKAEVDFVARGAKRKKDGPKTQQITVPYYDSGGTNPVLLLLHGSPGGHEVWAPLVVTNGLTNLFRVIMPDLPGHGLATSAAQPLSFETQAAFVATFMENRGISNAVVAGHSYGGEVAWRLASGRDREKVTKLVLIDAVGFPRPDLEVSRSDKETLGILGCLASSLCLAPFKCQTKAGLEETWHPSNWKTVHTNGVVDLYDLFVSLHGNFAVLRTLTRQEVCREDRANVEARLRSVRQPTLLIWGRDDPAWTFETQALGFLNCLQKPTLVVIPQCGHHPHEEKPRQTAEALRKWLMESQ